MPKALNKIPKALNKIPKALNIKPKADFYIYSMSPTAHRTTVSLLWYSQYVSPGLSEPYVINSLDLAVKLP